jgi:MoxR-like ATPase
MDEINNQQQSQEANMDNSNMEINQIYQSDNDFETELKVMNKVNEEASKILIGQNELIDLMLICILSEGHILLEGVPGIAKTLSAKTIAKTIGADFSRIQFTPDLMPSDITGTSVFNMNNSTFSFKKGPIFSNVVLIDEINRAPAKTQSALFEVMEERQISYDGTTFEMGDPFIVIATQNPIEQEGTYRLPEAQLDRFMMKILLNYPSFQEEKEILLKYKNHTGKIDLNEVKVVLSNDEIQKIKAKAKDVFISEHIIDYITKIVHETRNNGRIYLGASPRASLSIMKAAKIAALIAKRKFIVPDDIQFVTPHILNHRIILTPEAEMSGITPHQLINEIIKKIEVPR